MTTGRRSLLVSLLIALPLRNAGALDLADELTEDEAATARRAMEAGGAKLRSWCESNHAQIDRPLGPLIPGGRTLLGIAVHSRNEKAIRGLLACGANPSAPDRFGATPLHLAPLSGLGKLLIAAGADVNALDRDGYTPLHAAIGHRDEELVVRLLARGANPNPRTFRDPPLVEAASVLPKVVPLLLKKGADPRSRDRQGRTGLHRAAASANVSIAQLLIRRGAPVGARDKDGATALHVLASPPAGSQGFVDIQKNGVAFAKLLLNSGAAIDAQDTGGQTAVHRSVQSNVHDLLALFIARRASLEITDTNGQTPLLMAAHFGRAEALKALLAAGANPLAKDKEGATALHLAAGGVRGSKNYWPPRDAMYQVWVSSEGHLAALDLLLAAGVDRQERNLKGQTAEQVARERGLILAADRLAR